MTGVYNTCAGPPTVLNFDNTPGGPSNGNQEEVPNPWTYPGTDITIRTSGQGDGQNQFLVTEDYTPGTTRGEYAFAVRSSPVMFRSQTFSNINSPVTLLTVTISSTANPFQPVYAYVSTRFIDETISTADVSGGNNPACSLTYP